LPADLIDEKDKLKDVKFANGTLIGGGIQQAKEDFAYLKQ